MGVSSDYEIKTYKHLVIKFTVQLLLFIIGVLSTSAIFMGIEKHYDDGDFHYPYYQNLNHSNVLPETEVDYLKNHSSVRLFARQNNLSLVKVLDFVQNVTAALNRHYQILELQDASKYLEEEGNLQGNLLNGDFTDKSEQELMQMEQAVERNIWNIQDHGMTFLEAFVLTLSIISTIGWGHVTPITKGGQAFAIIVALIGIPLTLVMVISGCHLVMRSLKASLRNLFRCATRFNEDRLNDYTRMIYKPILIFLLFAYVFVTAAIIGKTEEFTYGQAVWYVMMGLTTIGFGDVTQNGVFHYDQQAHRTGLAVFMMFWIVFGFISVGSVVLSFLYDYSSVNGQHHQHFYKKNQEELVDETDDYEPNVYGGNTIYTGGDVES